MQLFDTSFDALLVNPYSLRYLNVPKFQPKYSKSQNKLTFLPKEFCFLAKRIEKQCKLDIFYIYHWIETREVDQFFEEVEGVKDVRGDVAGEAFDKSIRTEDVIYELNTI